MNIRRPLPILLQFVALATAVHCSLSPALSASKPTYAHKMEIGQLLYFNGDVDRAINAFRMAGELNPKAFEPHLNLINLYIGKGDAENMQKAADECQEVLKRKPGNKDVRLILGNIMRTQAGLETDPEAAKKKFLAAKQEVEEAEKIGASEAMCENTIGMILLQMGDTDEALKHIDQAIKKQNNFPDAHLVRAVLLFKGINKTDANGQPVTPAPDYNSPDIKKRIEEVLNELDTATEQKNGVNPEAVNTKADIEFATGRLQDAAKHYKQAAEQESKYAQAWAGLGNCEAQLATQETDEEKKNAHVKEAKEAYDKAKRLKPTDKNIVYGLAIMLEKMGRTHEAISEFQEGLMLESDPMMKAQISLHIQQLMGGNMGDFGSRIGGAATSGVGNSIFTTGALSQPFAKLIHIKEPPGKEGEKKAE